MDIYKKEKRKANPRERANILSYFTFGYTLSLFKRGFRKDLEDEDLYEVIKNCKSKTCGDKTEEEWNKSRSIYKLLWKRFGKEYTILCLANIFWHQFYSIAQPYGLSRLISYFEKNQTKISKSDAYYCAGIVVILKVLSVLFLNNLLVFEFNFQTKIQTSLKSLLYRKTLKLSPASFSDTNLGNIVTILTKDIQTLEHGLWVVMDFTIHIIETLTYCYLIWAKMGNSAFVGLGLLFVTIPVQIYLSTLLTKMELKIGENCDKRLLVTQEVLSAIKIIKMYTWEKFFLKKISEARKKEMIILTKTYCLFFILTAMGMLASKLNFLIVILTYIWSGNTTSTEMIFYILTCFNELSLALAIYIPLNMGRTAQFRAAFIRFNKLLQTEEVNSVPDVTNGKPFIQLSGVSITIKEKNILSNIFLKISNPGLVMVTGAVGSGKTSLMKTLLQDYSTIKGDIKVQGTISYASQDPWLFPASIKQNILFGQKYLPGRYKSVLEVCALTHDLSFLENGDETIVADRGMNLSKGQQCRINLARAVYKYSDIYLLDDPLAALDGHVRDYIFRRCVKSFLNDKICILVTQDASHIEKADKVLVMNQGNITYFGKPKDVDVFTSNGNKWEDVTKFDNCSNLEVEQQITHKNIYHETKQLGKVQLEIYKKYLEFGGGYIVLSIIIFLCIGTQICESSSDKFLTQWIDLQQEVLDLQSNSTVNMTYFETITEKKDYIFNFYTIMVVSRSLLALISFFALLIFCRRASIQLHNVMSCRVVNAVITFFDTYLIGNILNRFSYDLSNIDGNIAYAIHGIIIVIFSTIGGVVLVATVNWLFLLPSAVFLIIMVFLRMAYMPTARSLKRLEAATRSPLVGYINSTLGGLTTIRSFKMEQMLKDEFDRHQDLYTSAVFTLLCMATSFDFFMESCSALFTIIVVARFLFFEHDVSAGNVGLALTQVFMLTIYLQWGMIQWSKLENDMTSVERVLEYTNVEQEDTSGSIVEDWPKQGSIQFEAVSLRYGNTKELVLKDINFFIEPKRKVGIVGRTGAGKSSIISALFRLYKFEGNILVDGVDISTISLTYLRQSIALIPQDPILFTGTIRENIDPKGKYTDGQIWQAIKRVKIKNVSSLDLQIKEGGSSFSSGQKQLICLARATLGKYKIVVFDEATSNMDVTTEDMLHGVIEEIFSDCTILTIAHRLSTILNYDLVMVLDRGNLVEIDNPQVLLQNKSSIFYNMCRNSKR